METDRFQWFRSFRGLCVSQRYRGRKVQYISITDSAVLYFRLEKHLHFRSLSSYIVHAVAKCRDIAGPVISRSYFYIHAPAFLFTPTIISKTSFFPFPAITVQRDSFFAHSETSSLLYACEPSSNCFDPKICRVSVVAIIRQICTAVCNFRSMSSILLPRVTFERDQIYQLFSHFRLFLIVPICWFFRFFCEISFANFVWMHRYSDTCHNLLLLFCDQIPEIDAGISINVPLPVRESGFKQFDE